MPSTRATPGGTGLRGWRAFRERRRLTLARTARGLERVRQPFNLPPQAVALAFEPPAFTRQIRTLTFQPRIVFAESFRFLAGPLDLTAQPFEFALSVLDRSRGACAPARASYGRFQKKVQAKHLDRSSGPANQLRPEQQASTRIHADPARGGICYPA
jgi:hypothetical protein